MKQNKDTVPSTSSSIDTQLPAAHADGRSQANLFQGLFHQQKRLFATGVTRSYAWRIEQLDRMGRLLLENEAALQQNGCFKISRLSARSTSLKRLRA